MGTQAWGQTNQWVVFYLLSLPHSWEHNHQSHDTDERAGRELGEAHLPLLLQKDPVFKAPSWKQRPKPLPDTEPVGTQNTRQGSIPGFVSCLLHDLSLKALCILRAQGSQPVDPRVPPASCVTRGRSGCPVVAAMRSTHIRVRGVGETLNGVTLPTTRSQPSGLRWVPHQATGSMKPPCVQEDEGCWASVPTDSVYWPVLPALRCQHYMWWFNALYYSAGLFLPNPFPCVLMVIGKFPSLP